MKPLIPEAKAAKRAAEKLAQKKKDEEEEKRLNEELQPRLCRKVCKLSFGNAQMLRWDTLSDEEKMVAIAAKGSTKGPTSKRRKVAQ